MNLFEHELKMMFDDTDIIKDVKICGKTLLGKLDDELRIKLQFVSTLIARQYDAIKATILTELKAQLIPRYSSFRILSVSKTEVLYPL